MLPLRANSAGLYCSCNERFASAERRRRGHARRELGKESDIGKDGLVRSADN
jgi:hypothetical protein